MQKNGDYARQRREESYTDAQRESGEKIRELAARSEYGWRAFYKTYRWVTMRKKIIARDHGACQVCRDNGKYTPATMVHHIVPLKEAPELALEPDNLMSVCKNCHEKIHEGEKDAPPFWIPERW